MPRLETYIPYFNAEAGCCCMSSITENFATGNAIDSPYTINGISYNSYYPIVKFPMQESILVDTPVIAAKVHTASTNNCCYHFLVQDKEFTQAPKFIDLYNLPGMDSTLGTVPMYFISVKENNIPKLYLGVEASQYQLFDESEYKPDSLSDKHLLHVVDVEGIEITDITIGEINYKAVDISAYVKLMATQPTQIL
jgi:hypothetical protein